MMRIGMILLALLLIAGCTPRAALTVQVPAKIDTQGIKKVAVGPLEIAGVRIRELNEQSGRWTEKIVTLTPAEQASLAKQVRARVINRMAETPYFVLVYQDEFEKLENDAALEQMIAAGGYRTGEVDAVIHGRFWLEMERRRGVEPGYVDLTYRSGGQDNITLGMNPVAFWPYIEAKANLSMELRLVRLKPEEVVAMRSVNRSYGFKLSDRPVSAAESNRVNQRSYLLAESETERKLSNNVLPSLEELAADLADSIALSFTQEVAVSERVVYHPIAEGDQTGVVLIRNGAYEMAIQHLEALTRVVETPEDLYNLGLCYEAVGDYGLARNMYREAWQKFPNNLLLAAGLGRIEALTREYPKLRDQLEEKRSSK